MAISTANDILEIGQATLFLLQRLRPQTPADSLTINNYITTVKNATSDATANSGTSVSTDGTGGAGIGQVE